MSLFDVSEDFELKEKIKLAVDAIIENISKSNKTTEIYKPVDEGDIDRVEIPVPERTISPEYNNSPDSEIGIVTEIVEYMISSDSIRIEEYMSFDIHRQYFHLDESIEEPDRDQKREAYIELLKRVAASAVKYAGSYEIDQNDFNRAYAETVFPSEEIPTMQRYVSPLVNFRSSESFELYSNIHLDGYQWDDRIEKIEITPPNIYEIASIYTTHNWDLLSDSGIHEADLDYCVRIKAITRPSFVTEAEITKAVVTALRLFKLYKVVDYGKTYAQQKGPLYYRNFCFDPVGSSPSDYVNQTPRPTEDYVLSADEIPAFQEFWEAHAEVLLTDSNDIFSEPIRRYRGTFQKQSYEDVVVDSVIGMESTILKDLGTQNSILFRLKLRSYELIGEEVRFSKDDLWNLIDNIYFSRSEIVHGGKSLEEIIEDHRFEQIDGKEPSPRQFANLCQSVLALIIREYLTVYNQSETNITEKNKQLDNEIISED
ncbi:hypothetical protein [Haloarcula amylolytica]|uniref:hypothetical protein n=1 Tax=Haloarcula amylolytica TaxID=396317 RepID=UPI003C75E435